MGPKTPIKKIDMLEWIMKRRRVWPYELADHFGFTPGYVSVLLARLKRDGLITNMGRGCWVLTEEAFKKLKYYGRR